jgi:hypothetical protein
MKTLHRTIHPETRVIDQSRGIVEYIASDETLDSYREIIRASGWRFNMFEKNAPFVDSHNYGSIEMLLGSVIDFRVVGSQLIETVQWAIDVEENKLARVGFAMTAAGHLRAVSVGFRPVRWTSAGDTEWARTLAEMRLPADTPARTIYLEQEQVELSACILGANPNALARSYKDGAINDEDIDFLSSTIFQNHSALAEKTARLADEAAAAKRALEQQREREEWLRKFNQTVKGH